MSRPYACEKCQHTKFKTGQLRAAGGFFSKLFDVQSRKFTTVSCSNCGYTEIYKGDTSVVGNIFDFFTQ